MTRSQLAVIVRASSHPNELLQVTRGLCLKSLIPALWLLDG
jgi:hypothetical protein